MRDTPKPKTILILLIFCGAQEVPPAPYVNLRLFVSEPQVAEDHIHVTNRGFVLGPGLNDIVLSGDDPLFGTASISIALTTP